MRAGYFQGYTDAALDARIADLETNQSTQQASLAAIGQSIVAAFFVLARGSVPAAVVASATRVRLPLPVLSAKQLPDDGRWQRGANGVISYDGSLAGVYDVICVVNFQTTLALLTRYTFALQEGTGLVASEAGVRDTVPGSLERQLAGANTTTCVAAGPLELQPTGGELALRVETSAGISATVTATEVLLYLHRIDPVPIPGLTVTSAPQASASRDKPTQKGRRGRR